MKSPDKQKRRTIKDDGPDPIDVYIGSRVRAQRVSLRTSQTKLGEAIGLTFQQIQKYESGMNRIGASNMVKIAKALGVTAAYLFEGADQFEEGNVKDLSEGANLHDLDRRDIEFLSDLTKIPDPGNKNIRELVKGLAKA
jgi:transcriptional regulator with XRE-family HTH domain